MLNLSLLSQLGLENIVNNQKQLNTSLSKLSSGLKITSASDDASGLAIADNLRTQATGLNQAINNANSAIAFIQIGDKAMSEQSNILDFVKQKLIQSATDTTSEDGRQTILNDIKKALEEYDTIASSTNYNGVTILQKNSSDKKESDISTFQVGDSAVDVISIDAIQANTSFGGGTQIDTLSISGDIKEKDIFTITINGIPVSYVATASDVGSTEDKHNQVALGLKSEIESNSQLSNLITVENSSNGVLKFTNKNDGNFFNINPGTITLDTNITNTFSGLTGAVAQQLTYSFIGTVEKGDIYTLGGVSYTVQGSDTSMNNIIDKLVQGLNGTGSGVVGLNITSTLSGATASRNSSGNLVLTANTAGIPFTTPSFSTTNISSVSDQTITSNEIQANVQEVVASPEVLEEKVFSLENTAVVEAGDMYALNIDGKNISYTVKTTDSTKSDIINGLYTLLSNNSSLSYINFTNEGNDIRMTAARNFSVTPSTTATLFITEPTIITTTTLQQNETGQSADYTTTPNIIGIPSLQEITQFQLSGTALPGSTLFFYITDSINHNIMGISYIIQNGDTLDDLKNGLLNAFNNSYYSTQKVNISDGSDTLVQLNQFEMNIDASGNIIVKSYIGSANTGLYNSQNGGYIYSTPTDLDNKLAILKLGTTNFTPTITPVKTYSAEVFPVTPQAQQVKYTLSGTVEPGDIYTVGNITYTVQPTDSTIRNIVDKLIIGLNGGTATGLSGTTSLSGVTASKDASGMLLLTANVPGTPFTAPTFQTTNAVTSNDQNISLINTVNNVVAQNENRYSVSGFINEGNTYNIGGAIYTAQAGDTIEDVIDGLVNSVNGSNATCISGTPISGVVAIKTPPPIQISIKPSISYTISANLDLSNISANELKNDLSISSNNVVTFNSSSGKYSTYTKDSTVSFSNETQNIDTQNIQSSNSLSGLKNLNSLTVDIAKSVI